MIFKNSIELAKYIKSLGGELWQVGGSVRDELLGRKPKDIDYVITGLSVEDIPFEKIIGQSFPVFHVKVDGKICEVALARTEKKSGHGYHGFSFNSDPSITIEQDLRRRDLTINSIAKNVLTNEIVDPYGGLNDIKNKILRHTSEYFTDDPLRAIRVARFAVKMNDFKIAEETIELLKTMREEIKNLSAERVWKELENILKEQNPSTFFIVLKETNLLDIWFPEIFYYLNKYHNIWNHIMQIIDKADTPLERFCLLTYNISDAKLTTAPIFSLCNRLKVPSEYKNASLFCAEFHMMYNKLKICNETFLRFILNNKKYIPLLLKVYLIDKAYDTNREKSIKEWNMLRDIIELALQTEKEISGKSLLNQGFDVKNGKKFGETLYQKRIAHFIKKCKDYEKNNI